MLTREIANQVVVAFGDMLVMTNQARARRREGGGRVAIAFEPVGASGGRGVSLAVDTVSGAAFSVAVTEGDHIVGDVEMTREIDELPKLLSRAFSKARVRMAANRRRTSRRRSR
jgi:hypothetical protein